jgi:biopolymer transport protein ExbD
VPPEAVPLVNIGLVVIVVVVIGAYGYSQITQPKKVSQKWKQRQKQTKPVKWKKKSRFEE